MKGNYYDENLNAQKLYRVYQTRYPKVKQYLESEISFVRNHLQGTERILEIGAGYGRIMKELAPNCKTIIGIDISKDNAAFGNEYLSDVSNAQILVMDAHDLDFQEPFDIILCLQNGLSAINAQPIAFIKKIMGLLTTDGTVFVSSYSPKFWNHRVAWFQEQAEKGLLGEIDMEKTRDGEIICKDGFRSSALSPEEMDRIGRSTGCTYYVTEADQSSLFLVISKLRHILCDNSPGCDHCTAISGNACKHRCIGSYPDIFSDV